MANFDSSADIFVTDRSWTDQVVLHTSFGDLDVELWPKEAPKVRQHGRHLTRIEHIAEIRFSSDYTACRQCATLYS